MSEKAKSVETTASPEAVWKLWSDPSTWGSWNPDVETARVEGVLGDGATGSMTTKSGGSHDIHFENVRAGQAFDLVTKPVPLTTFYFHCEITPRDGGSTITQGISMKGGLAWFFGMMAAPRIVESFTPILEGLKAKAEAG